MFTPASPEGEFPMPNCTMNRKTTARFTPNVGYLGLLFLCMGCSSPRDGAARETAVYARDMREAISKLLTSEKSEQIAVPWKGWSEWAETLVGTLKDQVTPQAYIWNHSGSEDESPREIVYRLSREAGAVSSVIEVRILIGEESAIILVRGRWRQGNREWRDATAPRALLIERENGVPRLTRTFELER